MALTVQTNTKKYCSYLFNNIDFSYKRFNLIISILMFYIYLFMFCFTILYFLTISVNQSKIAPCTFKISQPYNYTYKPFRVNRRRAATPGTIFLYITPSC